MAGPAKINFTYIRGLAISEQRRREIQLHTFATELAKVGAVGTVERERDGFKKLAALIDLFEDNQTEIAKVIKKKGGQI